MAKKALVYSEIMPSADCRFAPSRELLPRFQPPETDLEKLDETTSFIDNCNSAYSGQKKKINAQSLINGSVEK